ncbi:MAG: hypothetical protein AAGF81_12765 [Pseudomonadota bacterium]
MTTPILNRRDLLGTTATGVAALTALSGRAAVTPALAAISGPSGCIANHTQLAQNLTALVLDPAVGAREKAHALKTCRCVHCDVAIGPLV